MKIQRAQFIAPVLDPRNPSGLHRVEFVADASLSIDRDPSGVITITAANGARVSCSFPAFWVEAVPEPVPEPAREPVKVGKRGAK